MSTKSTEPASSPTSPTFGTPMEKFYSAEQSPLDAGHTDEKVVEVSDQSGHNNDSGPHESTLHEGSDPAQGEPNQSQPTDSEQTEPKQTVAADDHNESGQKDAHDEPEDPNALKLTLLLISGMRTVLKLDKTFLQTHSLSGLAQKMSVGDLRKSLFKSWRDDWGTSPAGVANIRLIHLGKVLEDSQTLEECGLVPTNSINVVHLSVKPESFELESSSKAKSKGRRRTSGGDDSHHSRCCIIS
uniref:ARAD1C01804p n=1 Tax=Blastobotrys adeninivorans TaxID=409370 RepID=A0A060T4Z0_BLAAD